MRLIVLAILAAAVVQQLAPIFEPEPEPTPPPPVHYQSPKFQQLLKKWSIQYGPPEMTEEEFNIEADRIRREKTKNEY